MKERYFGFYSILILAVLMLASEIGYLSFYGIETAIGIVVLCLMFGAILAGVALYLCKLLKYVPLVGCVASIAATVLFFIDSYDYLFEFFVGIEVTHLSAQFIVCAVLFVLTAIWSVFTLCQEIEPKAE